MFKFYIVYEKGCISLYFLLAWCTNSEFTVLKFLYFAHFLFCSAFLFLFLKNRKRWALWAAWESLCLRFLCDDALDLVEELLVKPVHFCMGDINSSRHLVWLYLFFFQSLWHMNVGVTMRRWISCIYWVRNDLPCVSFFTPRVNLFLVWINHFCWRSR